MENKFVISDFYNGILLGFLFENDQLTRIKPLEKNNVVGNIYCGYVKDVVKNLNACFVDFSDNQKGFLPMDDNIYKQGDKVLVQVASDKIKTKDYALTTKINLKGKYLVLTSGNNGISISRKITNEETRENLKELLKSFSNDDYGFIVRTVAEKVRDEDLLVDANDLVQKLETIYKKCEYSAPKTCILNENTIDKIIDEYINKYNCQVITDSEEIFQQIKFLDNVTLNEDGKVSLHNRYSLDKHLKESLSKHVWLKSGAYLIIEPTEALTVIDVNTGKAMLKTRREETIKKINHEAAREIVRQIKVRNLSGIIIIDFINMTDSSDYNELKSYLEELFINDYSKAYVMGFTKLGLMEVSRKKSEKPLHEFIG